MIHHSIVIVGGGPVGLTLALSLAKAGKAVTVIDQGHAKAADERVLALSYASYQILAELNVWPAAAATAIDCVQISHRGLGISQIKAESLQLEHLGYTIKYADLCEELMRQVQRQTLITMLTATVSQVKDGNAYATAFYQKDGIASIITADLLIMAEGGQLLSGHNSRLNYDYKQLALVAHVQTVENAAHTAYERFASGGPLVLLPYQDHFVMVWSLATAEARLLQDNLSLLEQRLDQAFTNRLGGARVMAKPASFPLKLAQADNRQFKHMLLIGNSAQTVHPVSAQGLNLGLRDVRVLCRYLLMTPTVTPQILVAYSRRRQTDVNAVIGFTHWLATNLEGQGPLSTHMRGLGLILLSNLPPLQNYIARSLIYGI